MTDTPAGADAPTESPTQGTAVPLPAPNPENLMNRAVCLVVRRGKLGVRRKAKAVRVSAQMPLNFADVGGAVMTDADTTMVSVSKKLLDCTEYGAITTVDGKVRTYLEERCLPSMFKRGIWLLPIDLVDDVWSQLEIYSAERQAAVDAFLAVYEQKCDEAAGKLRTLYNASDYPPLERVRNAFHFSWQLVSFDVPGRLNKLRKDLYDAEKKKMADSLQAAAEEIQTGLRAAFQSLITSMAASLEPDNADGKKKKFYSSKLEHLSTFLALFQARNITDDSELAALVKTARDLIDGVDVEMIRDSDELRTAMSEEFSALGEQLSTLVGAAPRRLIDLDDEQESEGTDGRAEA